MRRQMFVVAVSLLWVHSAGAGVIPAGNLIAGQTQLSLADGWWPQMLPISLANNPLLDTTGVNAGFGETSSVFYLAGSLDGPVTRTITVPAGKPLFFPIVNAYIDNTNIPGEPVYTDTAAELLEALGDYLAPENVTLFATIDGVSVPNLASYRRQTLASAPFSYTTTSPDNLVDGVAGLDSTLGTGVYPSTVLPVVDDGYYLGLTPFAAGSTHTIRFGGGNSSFSQDNTYTVTTAPEPAAIALLVALVGAVPTSCLRRRRQVAAITTAQTS